MNIADCEFATQQLLAFLAAVGPVEAAWAMATALAEMQTLPASADHRVAAAAALRNAMAAAASSHSTESADTEADPGGDVEQAGQPVATSEQPEGQEEGDGNTRAEKSGKNR